MHSWSIELQFKAPGTILSDNGGEFKIDLSHLGEQFKINIIEATLAESSRSNDIVDCHNAVLRKMVNKSMYPIDVIVAWAVSAKTLIFWQIWSAIKDVTHNQLVLKHMNVMHEPGKILIEEESNEKLSRALKSKQQQQQQK